MEKIRGAVAVFIGAVSFGILSTFVKLAYAENFTLGEVTGIQALFGMVFLWMLYAVGYRGKSKGVVKTSKLKLLTVGISTGSVSILYYKCVELVPASIAIVLLMQFIWISPIIGYFVFKQKASRRQVIGIVGILASTLLATGLFEKSIQDLNPTGLLYGLLAATAYAVFILVNGKVGNDYSPVQKSALMITGAFLFIMLVLQPARILTFQLDQDIAYYGLVLSFFGTVLPPLLFAYGMPRIGVPMGSILSAVELPVAVIMSYTILSESVSILQWLGVLLILAIVVWINWSEKAFKAL